MASIANPVQAEHFLCINPDDRFAEANYAFVERLFLAPRGTQLVRYRAGSPYYDLVGFADEPYQEGAIPAPVLAKILGLPNSRSKLKATLSLWFGLEESSRQWCYEEKQLPPSDAEVFASEGRDRTLEVRPYGPLHGTNELLVGVGVMNPWEATMANHGVMIGLSLAAARRLVDWLRSPAEELTIIAEYGDADKRLMAGVERDGVFLLTTESVAGHRNYAVGIPQASLVDVSGRLEAHIEGVVALDASKNLTTT
jgi:hypothetical protein